MHHYLLLGYFDGREFVQMMPFIMVIAIVGFNCYFCMRKKQLWHETARLALEKGQPLPPGLNGKSRNLSSYHPGLIMLGVGIGLLFVPFPVRAWAPLPLCVGIAMLIGARIAARQSKQSDDPQDPAKPQ